MKKFSLVIAVAICMTATIPAKANDNDLAGAAQLQLSVDHVLWEESSFPGYVNGIFHYDLNSDWPMLYGYAGPIFKIGKVNIYPLFVTMNDPSGWGVGPSLWLEYAGEKHYLFAEYDHYVPFLSSQHGEDAVLPPHSYYSLSEYNYSLNEKTKLGAALELYGLYEENRLAEFAYGPYAQMGKFKLWLFYDETPNLVGQNYLGLRFKFSI